MGPNISFCLTKIIPFFTSSKEATKVDEIADLLINKFFDKLGIRSVICIQSLVLPKMFFNLSIAASTVYNWLTSIFKWVESFLFKWIEYALSKSNNFEV